MASLGDLAMRLGVDLSGFHAAMDGIPGRLQEAAKQAEKAWAPLETLGSSLMSGGAALSAALTVPIAGVGAAAIQMGEQLNMAKLSFTTMLGSAEKAGAYLEQLKAFAAGTPFEFPDLVEASKRMLAMGFSADQVIPTLRTIGDSVAALGGGKDMIDGVTLALGQMQAKGKVSAQEMNQLAERGIPAWQMLADQIGVSIPEAMKLAEKGAITASEAVPAILDGMQKKFGGQMKLASETLTGVWSNFKDTVTMTLAELGTTLTPVLKSAVQAAMPLLEWAKAAAQWFAQLPEPIKMGAIALGAMLAAVGPLAFGLGGLITAVTTIGTAIAPIAGAIGITTAAFAGWLAVIPLVVAALVALGVWVYDNWDAITATLAQAWDGIREVWGAVWGFIYDQTIGKWVAFAEALGIWEPIKSFFSTLWDGTKAVFVGTWNAIKDALVWVWEAIAASASRVWGSIVSVFQTFLEWAQKIPGVNKLMNLDEAWASAKKLEQQTAKTTEAVQAHAEAHDKGAPKIQKSNKATEAAEDAHKKAAKAVVEHHKKSELLFEMHRQLEAQHKKNVQELVKWQLAHKDAESRVVMLTEASADLTKQVDEASRKMQAFAQGMPTVNGLVKDLTEQMKNVKAPTDAYEEALKKLGITSRAELSSAAAEAKKLYDAVANDPRASAMEKDNALLRLLQAQKAEMVANGTAIPREMQAMLDKLEGTVKGPEGLPKVTQPFTDFLGNLKKDISTAFSNLSDGIGDAVRSGDWSKIGETFKNFGGQMKDAFLERFNVLGDAFESLVGKWGESISNWIASKLEGLFKPFTDKITEWIGGAVSNALGKGVSGAAGSVAGTAGGSIPTGGGGGGTTGGGGGVLGSLGGVAGAVNLASGVVSAISGVFTAIGTYRLEGTMNAVEENTRYGMIHTLFMLEHINQYLPKLDSINGFLWDTYIGAFASLMTTVEEIRDMLKGSVSSVLGDRRADTNEPAVIAGTDTETLGEMLNRIGDDLLATLRPMAAQVGQIIDPWLIDIHGMHRQFYTGKPWDQALDKVINGKQTTIIEFVIDGRKFSEAIIDDLDAVAGRRLQVIGQRVS